MNEPELLGELNPEAKVILCCDYKATVATL